MSEPQKMTALGLVALFLVWYAFNASKCLDFRFFLYLINLMMLTSNSLIFLSRLQCVQQLHES